jgi:hypothetical protein
VVRGLETIRRSIEDRRMRDMFIGETKRPPELATCAAAGAQLARLACGSDPANLFALPLSIAGFSPWKLVRLTDSERLAPAVRLVCPVCPSPVVANRRRVEWIEIGRDRFVRNSNLIVLEPVHFDSDTPPGLKSGGFSD